MASSSLFIMSGGGGSGSSSWSSLTNPSANLTLSMAGFTTTFNQTSGVEWKWANTTAATSGTAQSSPIHSFSGQYWTGAASAEDKWTIQDVVANGTNGVSTLTFTHNGSSGLAIVSIPSILNLNGLASPVEAAPLEINANAAGVGFLIQRSSTDYTDFVSGGVVKGLRGSGVTATPMIVGNQSASLTLYSGTGTIFISANAATPAGDFTGALKLGALTQDNATAATSGTAQSSPIQTWSGRYWDGAASQTDSWTIQDVVANGTNGASTLTIAHSGSTGAAKVSVPVIATTVTGTASACAVQVNAANSGFYGTGGNNGLLCATGSTAIWQAIIGSPGAGLMIIGNTVVLGFALNASSNMDVGFSRIGAGVVALGTGASGSTAGNLQLNQIAKYNNEVTAGPGVGYIRGSTSQKAETGADANVLTVTPAAAAGSYRLTVVLSLSAATAATIGWTATWTDSNGNAQTPTNLALLQTGAAAPALTFTTSAAGNYYGSCNIDVNNAGTNIVIQTTFAGTSVAYKVSATIERII